MSGGVSTAALRHTLQAAFQPTNLVVIDTSDGCGSKFQVYIASQQFVGKKVLERHRMVNEAVKPHMDRVSSVQQMMPKQTHGQSSD